MGGSPDCCKTPSGLLCKQQERRYCVKDLLFNCPFCGQEIEAPPEFAGRGNYCPSCDRWILVPCKTSSGGRMVVIRRPVGVSIAVISAGSLEE